VERAVARKEEVSASVWRGGAQSTLRVKAASLTGSDVERVVEWAGATLQAPIAPSVRSAASPPRGFMSPISSSGRRRRVMAGPGRRIVEVDGQLTPDIDAFLRQVSGRPDRSSLRIKFIDMERRTRSDHSEARSTLLAIL